MADEQADLSGDSSATPEGEFTSSVDLVTQVEEHRSTDTEDESTVEEKQPEPSEAPEKEMSSKSQAEWQEMKDKANKADELTSKLEEAFGNKEDSSETEQDLGQQALNQIENLKNQVEIAKFEGEHPVLKEEGVKQAWGKVNKEGRYSQLTLDERLKLVTSPKTENLVQDLVEQAKKAGGSVPTASTSVTQPNNIDVDLIKLGSKGGISEASIRKYIR